MLGRPFIVDKGGALRERELSGAKAEVSMVCFLKHEIFQWGKAQKSTFINLEYSLRIVETVFSMVLSIAASCI